LTNSTRAKLIEPRKASANADFFLRGNARPLLGVFLTTIGREKDNSPLSVAN